MTLKYGNAAKEQTQTTGTGTYELIAIPGGKYQTLVDSLLGTMGGASPFTLVPYRVSDGTDFEIGIGTVTDSSPDTLSRDLVLESSNSDNAVNWGAGTRDVIIGRPAIDMIRNQLPTDTGTANTYAIAWLMAEDAYSKGMEFEFIAANANNGNSTLNVNAIGAVSILKNVTEELSEGDIKANSVNRVKHDGTNLHLMNSRTLRKNEICGLITSNNVTDSDHDIDIDTGECRSADNSVDMVLGSVLTKRIDAAWAAGTNAGGMDTGTVAASSFYYKWLIKNPTTGVVDAIFSLSGTAPTMPAGFTKKRLIGGVATDASSNIIQYIQIGNYFLYLSEGPLDVSDNTITSGVFETGTATAPRRSMALIYALLTNPSLASVVKIGITVKPVGSFESFSVAYRETTMGIGTNGFDTDVVGQCDVYVDNNSQFEYGAIEPGAAATVQVSMRGFIMFERSDPT